MIETVLSNDHLPKSERFEWYRELVGREFLSSVVSSEETDDFPASARRLDTGVAQVGVLEYPPLSACRSPRTVRSEDIGAYWLFINDKGRQGLSAGRSETALDAGGMTLLDGGRPFDAWARPTAGQTRTVFVAFPKEAVSLPQRLLDRLTGVRLDTDGRVGGHGDPSCAHLTVRAIGARWGFPQASELSRAFSAAYGVPPGEYRGRVAGGSPGPTVASRPGRPAPEGARRPGQAAVLPDLWSVLLPTH